MLKSVRMVPKTESDNGQIITFVLAIGSVRQVCQLETTFRTQTKPSTISTNIVPRSSVSLA